jgi:hypothetical protein
VATTGGGAAGAVRVSGAPSGGVSGAGAAAADDVGSVIDFLSGAGVGRDLRFYRKLLAFSGLTSKSTRRPWRLPELGGAEHASTAVGRPMFEAAVVARFDAVLEDVRLTV